METCLQLSRIADIACEASTRGPDWLSESEHMRLQAITSARRRAEFLAGRWTLRHMLAACHGGHPLMDWSLSAPEQGPPQLLETPGTDAPVHFALSHSGDWLACATSSAAIGLDIETSRRRRDIDALTQAACTPAERSRFAALPSGRHQTHWQTVWTLKEAYQKRMGLGVDLDILQRLETSPAPSSAHSNARVWHGPGMVVALVGAVENPVRLCLSSSLSLLLAGPVNWTVRPCPLR